MEVSPLAVVSYVVLWAIVLALVALTLSLARLVGRLSRRLPPGAARVIDPGPEVGESIEGWKSIDLLGRPVEFHFPRERGLLLVYVSAHCSTCAALLPAAKSFMREIARETEGAWVMVFGSGSTEIGYARQHGLDTAPVLTEKSLPATFQLEGAPFACWVDPMGIVRAKGMVNHREHLESLARAVELGHGSMDSYLTELAEQQELERSDASQRA